ncbi:MAG: DUF2207 domain-containing protein [Caldilineales bacterium]|nr:DUF2207 domain-containing protein [Caldilineales bacterium]MDW8317685.1 DUF2207 domain-containing protein [Anaerolineae bacterium]
MRKRLWLLLAVLAALLLAAQAPTAWAQDKRLYWERYDVEITILPSGDFRVVETQELVFTGGSFTYGVRFIPTDYVTGISDVRVRDGDGTEYQNSFSAEPYTFSTSQVGNEFNIRYTFPPTDDRRTVIIEYTVSGGLLYYPGGDQLVWKAVPADPEFPIRRASVTVRLPPGVTVDNYDATGPRGEATLLDDGNAVRFETTEVMQGGPDFAVRVQWPHGVVAGEPTAWQQELDRLERIKPIANVTALFLTLFLSIAGPLGLYLLWYRKGRDAVVKLPAEWIPEPPGDLPPGMVGTLVDERADMKEVVATVVDLARRGALTVVEEAKPGAMGIGTRRDYIYRRASKVLPMRPYERRLVEKMFGDKQEVRLSDLQNTFYTYVAGIQRELYEAVTEEGFFDANPEKVRSRYARYSVLTMLIAAVVACVAFAALIQYTGLAFCVPIPLVLAAVGLAVLSRHMPRKTAKGAEEAAKWLAFKRYLENIEKYTQVAEATDLFDKYLPYAIAFGLDDEWIRKFSQVETPAPPWYVPVPSSPYTGGPYTGPRPVAAGGPTAGPVAEGAKPPTLADASKSMGRTLASMSAGLGAMLSQTASAMTSMPASTGTSGSGSWSAGGGSWSGGGGFSGGGWSGGGGFSGGGGGGSRFG